MSFYYLFKKIKFCDILDTVCTFLEFIFKAQLCWKQKNHSSYRHLFEQRRI